MTSKIAIFKLGSHPTSNDSDETVKKFVSAGVAKCFEVIVLCLTLASSNQQTWIERKDIMLSCTAILIVIEDCEAAPAELLRPLLQLAMDVCSERRKRIAHVVVNCQEKCAPPIDRRAKQMLKLYDLKTATPEQVIEAIQRTDNNSFSSPGESFAWQLIIGFLSYILPYLPDRIQSTLHDDTGSVRLDVLQEFEITDVDPKNVLVLPKYLLLLSEDLLSTEQSTPMCPTEVFPGCKKISKASSDLCLEFDSPGYKKRIPSYLLELEKPIISEQSTYTHVIIFCGYAAPIFIMQKLNLSSEEKQVMFQQFREELKFILNHPKSSELLRNSSECASGEVRGDESSVVEVVDVTDQSNLRRRIFDEVKSHVMKQSWCVLPESPKGQKSECLSVDDSLPVMSMSYAMAANSWIGFAQPLLNHVQQLSSDAQQLPFDFPYCFVIPTSGRYPDEKKLYKQFEEIGVNTAVEEFRVPSGRRYTFRVHKWESMRLAFEIPSSVLSIRKQAECGVGGIKMEHLSAHLAEFASALQGFAAVSSGCFKVIEWDDVTDFDEHAWTEPSREFALSLLRCLASSVRGA